MSEDDKDRPISGPLELIKPYIGNILISLPIINLVLSVIFFSGFCSGFGGNIEQFSSISDVISIASRSSLTIYWSAMLAVLIAFIATTEAKKDYGHFHPAMREAMKDYDRDKAMNIELAVAVIGTPTLVLSSMYYFNFSDATMAFILTGIVGPFVFSVLRIAGLAKWSCIVLIAGSAVTAFVGARGVDDGLALRYTTYDMAIKDGFTCNKLRILRSIGPYYLVVDNFNRKHLVDLNCKIKYSMTFYIGSKPKLK